MPMRLFRLALAAFVVLTTGVLVNLMLLQGPMSGLRTGTRSAHSLALERERQLALAVPTTGTPTAMPGRSGIGLKPEQLASDTTLDKGDTIRAVQRELQLRGYLPGNPDGVAGLVTRAAIMAWEHDNGLQLTAEPSNNLLKRILLGPGSGHGEQTASRDTAAQVEILIRTVQQSLSGLGYNTGKADGRLGDDTVRAIRDFESDNGMPETGRISGQLVAKLAKLASNGKLAARR